MPVAESLTPRTRQVDREQCQKGEPCPQVFSQKAVELEQETVTDIQAEPSDAEDKLQTGGSSETTSSRTG